MSAGQWAFRLAFEIAPITLTGGIASNIVGGALSMLSLTQSLNFSDILSGGSGLEADDFFGLFYPMPGTQLISQQIGQYPFINRAVAGNATIAEPLRISLRLICPVKDPGGYAVKAAIMTSLQNTLSQHNAQGGLYNVATPFFTFTDCILVDVSDMSSGETLQPQAQWRWDFEKPLISLQQAYNLYNTQMQMLSSGAATDGAGNGFNPFIDIPSSVTAPFVLPSATTSPASGVPSFSSVTSVPYATPQADATVVSSNPFTL